MASRANDPTTVSTDLFGNPLANPPGPVGNDVRAGRAARDPEWWPASGGDGGGDLFGDGGDGTGHPAPGRGGAPRSGAAPATGPSARGTASSSAGSGATLPAGPATDRQIGFAMDISRALRLPMPGSRDVETIGAFIAANRAGLRGARTRP